MNIPILLIPVSLPLVAFFWTLKADQFDDPEGQAHHVLSVRYDDRPAGEDKTRRT